MMINKSNPFLLRAHTTRHKIELLAVCYQLLKRVSRCLALVKRSWLLVVLLKTTLNVVNVIVTVINILMRACVCIQHVSYIEILSCPHAHDMCDPIHLFCFVVLIPVLWDVLWAEHRDAQTGRSHLIPHVCSSVVFYSIRGGEAQEEPLIGCEPNWASLIGCKQMALRHTNKAAQMQTCAGTCTITAAGVLSCVKLGFASAFW